MSFSRTEVPLSLSMFKSYCERQFELMNAKFERIEELRLCIKDLKESVEHQKNMLCSMSHFIEKHAVKESCGRVFTEIPGSHESIVSTLATKALTTVCELITENKTLKDMR